VTLRYLSAPELAAETGLSARWFTRQAAEGKIPGACQPGGPRGDWRFEAVRFWRWWHEREARGKAWQASTGAAGRGGGASSVKATTSGSLLRQRLARLQKSGSALGSTS
jgi:hypothetical protein